MSFLSKLADPTWGHLQGLGKGPVRNLLALGLASVVEDCPDAEVLHLLDSVEYSAPDLSTLKSVARIGVRSRQTGKQGLPSHAVSVTSACLAPNAAPDGVEPRSETIYAAAMFRRIEAKVACFRNALEEQDDRITEDLGPIRPREPPGGHPNAPDQRATEPSWVRSRWPTCSFVRWKESATHAEKRCSRSAIATRSVSLSIWIMEGSKKEATNSAQSLP